MDPTTINGLKTKRIAIFSGHATNITKTFVGLVDDIVRVRKRVERETRAKEDAKILRQGRTGNRGITDTISTASIGASIVSFKFSFSLRMS